MERKWRLLTRIVAILEYVKSFLIFTGSVTLLWCLYLDSKLAAWSQQHLTAIYSQSVDLHLSMWILCGLTFLLVVIANLLVISMIPGLTYQEYLKWANRWQVCKVFTLLGWLFVLIFYTGPEPVIITFFVVDTIFLCIVTKYLTDLRVKIRQGEERIRVIFQNIKGEMV